jgi:hypothetical protein
MLPTAVPVSVTRTQHQHQTFSTRRRVLFFPMPREHLRRHARTPLLRPHPRTGEVRPHVFFGVGDVAQLHRAGHLHGQVDELARYSKEALDRYLLTVDKRSSLPILERKHRREEGIRQHPGSVLALRPARRVASRRKFRLPATERCFARSMCSSADVCYGKWYGNHVLLEVRGHRGKPIIARTGGSRCSSALRQ